MRIKNVIEIVNNIKVAGIYKGDLCHYFSFLLNANHNPYHNLIHSCHVLEKAYEAAIYSHVMIRRTRQLLIAAMFHDFGHSGKMDNDDREIETALCFLKEIILPEDKDSYEAIANLILATRFPYIEGDFTETALILRDADLSQILADDWFELCVLGLSQEMGLNIKETLRENIKFLSELKFQSNWGKHLLQKKIVPRLHEVQYVYNAIS